MVKVVEAEIWQGRPSSSTLFDVVGASAAGPSHLATGKPCEDHFEFAHKDDWVVVVVSDGAGSASRAIEGAMVVSKEICDTFVARLWAPTNRDFLENDRFFAWVKSGVCEGIERARRECLLETFENESLASFHATVVGAIMASDKGALFHIGDGCASAHRNTSSSIETIAFSEPENGEYVNQTFFFTEDWWREHLRITQIPTVPDEVWLMTDGAYDLVVPPNQKKLRDFTACEIDRLVFSESVDRSVVLEEVLLCPQARRNGDDKTIVIVRRLQPNG